MEELFRGNARANLIAEIIQKANDFITNVTFDEFFELFDKTLHIDYSKQKFEEMTDHTTYFIATRGEQQYNNFMKAVEKYDSQKNVSDYR